MQSGNEEEIFDESNEDIDHDLYEACKNGELDVNKKKKKIIKLIIKIKNK